MLHIKDLAIKSFTHALGDEDETLEVIIDGKIIPDKTKVIPCNNWISAPTIKLNIAVDVGYTSENNKYLISFSRRKIPCGSNIVMKNVVFYDQYAINGEDGLDEKHIVISKIEPKTADNVIKELKIFGFDFFLSSEHCQQKKVPINGKIVPEYTRIIPCQNGHGVPIIKVLLAVDVSKVLDSKIHILEVLYKESDLGFSLKECFFLDHYSLADGKSLREWYISIRGSYKKKLPVIAQLFLLL